MTHPLRKALPWALNHVSVLWSRPLYIVASMAFAAGCASFIGGMS